MKNKPKIILIVSAILAVVLIVLFNKQISNLFNIFSSRADLDQGSIVLDGNNFLDGITNNDFKLDDQNRLVLNIAPTTHNLLSISDPSDYNEADILKFADWKIDIHNWSTLYGGKMTPYRNLDGSYYLQTNQKNLINELYNKSQRIFWIGITPDHELYFGIPVIYTEICNAVNAYVDAFNELSLTNVKVGIYLATPAQDEVLTNIRPGHTREDQYIFAEDYRNGVKTACGTNWNIIKWFNTGQDNYMGYQLTNDSQSYWAHHTNVSQVEDVEDLVYNDDYNIMNDPTWKTIWGSFYKFAWTDVWLVQGTVGNRTLTPLGQSILIN